MAKFLQGSRAVGSLAVTGLFLLALVAFVRFAQAILLPVVLSLLLYFLCKPVMVALKRIRVPRPIGAALVVAVLLGAVFTGMLTLQEPAREFLAKAPDGFRKIEEELRYVAHRLEQFTRPQNGHDTERTVAEPSSQTSSPLLRLNLAELLLSSTTLINTASFLTGLLETIVLLYFLLVVGNRFLVTLAGTLPGQSERDEAVALVNDVQRSISRYLSTITAINCGVAVVVAGLMSLLGVPNPVLWGVVAGVLNFMPYFGPLIVFTVLLTAGLLSFTSVGQALLPCTAYLCVHAVESNLITPSILGRRLTLNPLIIFLALMFWTWMWGVPGALLSVPLLMILKIVCNHTRPLAPLGEFIGG